MSRALGASCARSRCGDGISMIEVLSVMDIIGILVAVEIPMSLGKRARAKNAVVRKGGRAIAIAPHSYVAASGDDSWPPQADQITLRPHPKASEWPENPFTGLPMTHVAAPRTATTPTRWCPEATNTASASTFAALSPSESPSLR